jgi:hypothetical protein
LALSPETNESFLREVDEELRRDQIEGYWKRYGRIAAIVIGVFLIGLAAFLWWRAEQRKEAEARGETMSTTIADLQAGRKTDAAAKLSTLSADGGAYGAVAKFAQASLAYEKGDMKGASAIYKGLVADTSVPKPYRDLALIRQVSLDYDSMKPQQAIDMLKPLAVEGNPWFGSAGEMTAIAYLDMNKPKEADQLLAAIAADAKQPASIRGRARRLAGSLGADIPATPATPAAPADAQ